MAMEFQIVSGALLLLQNGQPVKAVAFPGVSQSSDRPQPLLGGRFAHVMAWPVIHIFDATTSKLRRVQPFGAIDGKVPEFRSLAAARSEHALFVTASSGETLLMARIDLTTGLVTFRHQVPGIQPDFYARRPMEAEDGTWINPVLRRIDGGFTKGIIAVHPVTGARQETFVPALGYADDFSNLSPDGAFCLCPDMTVLHRAEDRGSGQPLFGLTLQLWQTRPLAFLRRLTVGWFQADELPNETFYGKDGKPFRAEPGARQSFFTQIAEATERLALPPDGAARQEDFPEPFASSASDYGLLTTNWRAFAARLMQRVHWAPDSAGFWHLVHGFIGFAGIDGSSSARYYLPHLGLKSGSDSPFTKSPNRIEPLSGRRALVWYGDGLVEMEAPPAMPSALQPLPVSLGSWTGVKAASTPTEFYRAAEQAKQAARTIRVPLGGLEASSCMAAILALRDDIARELHGRIVEDQMNVVFLHNGAEMDEFKFFDHVEKLGPVMAPSLRALMQTLMDTPDLKKRHMYLFSVGEEGQGILHGAARAFARLDPDPIELTRRYGHIMDPEHEYSYVGAVVPALIANLGWTKDTIDFAIWIIAASYYNSISHDSLWNDWGMGAAAAKFYTPQDFATHFTATYVKVASEPPEEGKAYAYYFMDMLDRDITRKSPWTQQFFAALKTIRRAG